MKIYKITSSYEEKAEMMFQQQQEATLKQEIKLIIFRKFKRNSVTNSSYETQYHGTIKKSKPYHNSLPIDKIHINTFFEKDKLFGLEITIVIPSRHINIISRNPNNSVSRSIAIVKSGEIQKEVEQLTGVNPTIHLETKEQRLL